jgi:methionyl-tRNA formyltransferase
MRQVMHPMMTKIPPFAYFGTPEIATIVLERLKESGILPAVIITNPDAPQGRKMILTPSPVKIWAEAHRIPLLQPQSLKTDTTVEAYIAQHRIELGIVVAYGKIIPESLLAIPKHGIVNVHPSLLPRFRGASPIRSAILRDERETGVTIMLLDKDLDHGPLLAQEVVEIPKSTWPMRGRELDALLAQKGGELLATALPRFVSGEITPKEQMHSEATFCEKITKDMGELNLSADPYQNLLKIRAFDGWPGTFFFTEKNGKRIRVKITDAELASDGTLNILRVIPEGKSEMDFRVFLQS